MIKNNRKTVPVTVISWFLWAGKTTLLHEILTNRDDMKVAVIVNDMAELNIDEKHIKKTVTFSKTEESLVEMSNGCICCTLREDLLKEVKKLCETWSYDAIIIESTWISEPLPVAQTFSYADEETWIDLWERAHIDTMVTVVDATRFLDDLWSIDYLADRKNLWTEEEDERTIADLLLDQVEFCDILVVNKRDDIDEIHQKKLLTALKALQPQARLITTNHAKVPLSHVIDTWLFDFEEVSTSAGWMQELEHEHIPETEEYGISSFVYERKRPFHPQRLRDAMHIQRPGVIRGKWFLWLASRPDAWLQRSLAWKHISLGYWWRWLASMTPQERSFLEPEEQEACEAMSSEKHGDRNTQIVVIGTSLEKENIIQLLDNALVTDEEWAVWWENFDDPFAKSMVVPDMNEEEEQELS